MKKFAIITVTVGLIGALSAGAYAYNDPRSGGKTSQDTAYGPAWKQGQTMQGRGQGNRGMYQAQNAQTVLNRDQTMQGREAGNRGMYRTQNIQTGSDWKQDMQGRGRGNRGKYQEQKTSSRSSWKQGRAMRANRQESSSERALCNEYGRWNNAQPGWRAQAQNETAHRDGSGNQRGRKR